MGGTEKRRKEVKTVSSHHHGPFSTQCQAHHGGDERSLLHRQPWGHQDHQPPVSHPTHHQSQLAVSPSEMIPGTVTRMTHDFSPQGQCETAHREHQGGRGLVGLGSA